MSLGHKLSDFLSLEAGATGATNLVASGALALTVIAATLSLTVGTAHASGCQWYQTHGESWSYKDTWVHSHHCEGDAP